MAALIRCAAMAGTINIGGGGRDVFQFRPNDRGETIQDFGQGQDKIEFLSGARRFDPLASEQDGRNVLISFRAAVEIRIVTDSAAAFGEDDVIF